MLDNSSRALSPIRSALTNSHIGAITIAVLVLAALEACLSAVWIPFERVIDFVVTAIAILGIPFISHDWSFTDRPDITIPIVYLIYAATTVFAASMLSRWLYGEGPFLALMRYWNQISGGKRA